MIRISFWLAITIFFPLYFGSFFVAWLPAVMLSRLKNLKREKRLKRSVNFEESIVKSDLDSHGGTNPRNYSSVNKNSKSVNDPSKIKSSKYVTTGTNSVSDSPRGSNTSSLCSSLDAVSVSSRTSRKSSNASATSLQVTENHKHTPVRPQNVCCSISTLRWDPRV